MHGPFLTKMDSEAHRWAQRLHDTIGLHLGECGQLASRVFREVQQAGHLVQDMQISPRRRLHILEDMYIWHHGFTHTPGNRAPAQREHNASIEIPGLTELYVNFVYPTNELFDALSNVGDVSAKCARYIRAPEHPVRPLRNAIAHGRWDFADQGGIHYWDGDPPRRPWRRFYATEQDILFWRTLVRAVAWPALLALAGDDA